MGYKNNFINSSPFGFQMINVKILSNFQKEWCTFSRKKICLEKIRTIHSQGLNALNMQNHFLFVSNFKDVNFVINGEYSPKNVIIQIVMPHLCFFKHTKMFKECRFIWVAPLTMLLPLEETF